MNANDNASVTLHLQDAAHGNNQSDWINVSASNGQTYSYKYTGGNHASGHGNAVFVVGQGSARIQISLAPQHRYEVVDIKFHDGANQLSWVHEPGPPPRDYVDDKCQAAIQAYYKVIVADSAAGRATFPCDPMIVNEPR